MRVYVLLFSMCLSWWTHCVRLSLLRLQARARNTYVPVTPRTWRCAPSLRFSRSHVWSPLYQLTLRDPAASCDVTHQWASTKQFHLIAILFIGILEKNIWLNVYGTILLQIIGRYGIWISHKIIKCVMNWITTLKYNIILYLIVRHQSRKHKVKGKVDI